MEWHGNASISDNMHCNKLQKQKMGCCSFEQGEKEKEVGKMKKDYGKLCKKAHEVRFCFDFYAFMDGTCKEQYTLFGIVCRYRIQPYSKRLSKMSASAVTENTIYLAQSYQTLLQTLAVTVYSYSFLF